MTIDEAMWWACLTRLAGLAVLAWTMDGCGRQLEQVVAGADQRPLPLDLL